MIKEDSTGHEQIVPCEKWIYDTSVFHSTITMEWNLVCERAQLSPLFQTIYTAGCFLGAILGALTADRYGRRWSIKTGALLTTGFTVLLVFSRWFWLVMLTRFLLGVFNTIMIYPAFIISMEICNPSLRTTVGIFLALPYALMMIGLAGLAYWIRDWRILQAAASWPCLVLLVLMFLIDESPRWLIVKGRLEEAIKVLQRAVKLNRPNLSQELDVSVLVHSVYQNLNKSQTQKTKDEHNGSVPPLHLNSGKTQATGGNELSCSRSFNALGLDDGVGSWWAGPVALLRTKIIRKVTLVLVVVWLLQGVVYLGLPLSSSSFSSPFLYMALLGAFEVPAYSLTAPITKRLGRKSVVTTCLIGCGALLLSVTGLLLADMNNVFFIDQQNAILYNVRLVGIRCFKRVVWHHGSHVALADNGTGSIHSLKQSLQQQPRPQNTRVTAIQSSVQPRPVQELLLTGDFCPYNSTAGVTLELTLSHDGWKYQFSDIANNLHHSDIRLCLEWLKQEEKEKQAEKQRQHEEQEKEKEQREKEKEQREKEKQQQHELALREKGLTLKKKEAEPEKAMQDSAMVPMFILALPLSHRQCLCLARQVLQPDFIEAPTDPDTGSLQSLQP
ncbi:organic cation transporter protein-like [Macrobrachium rosenbergii]|uniref:organic cation transporter protein-like n=1 Tax=Macrobrachium rosenbergii TaxID=79674 RepID=UPI0034D727A8